MNIIRRTVGGEEIGECSECGHKVCAHVMAEVERFARVTCRRTAEPILVFEPYPPEPDTGPDPDYFDDDVALAEKESGR